MNKMQKTGNRNEKVSRLCKVNEKTRASSPRDFKKSIKRHKAHEKKTYIRLNHKKSNTDLTVVKTVSKALLQSWVWGRLGMFVS